MERTTKKQLDYMLSEVTKLSGLDLSLEAWTPGDNKGTRYAVCRSNGAIELSRCFFGKTEVYDALRLARNILEAMKRNA